MNRRRVLLTAGAALASLPVLGRLPALAAAGNGWTRLDLGGGLIVAPGTLNGRPLPVMIDSGSVPTLVDVTRARDLGLSLSGAGSAIGNAGGQAQGLKAGGFELAVAGVAIQFPTEGALALDLSPLLPGGGPGAVAGQALFEAARLDLDLPGARMRIAGTTPTGWHGVTLNREADGLRCMPLSIGSVTPATFDLGSAIPLQIGRDWAEAQGVLKGLRQSSWVATGIDGVSPFATAVLPRIELAGLELRNVPVAILDRQPQGASPAVIGMPVWRRFRLICDFPGERLWLRPGPGALKEPFNRDRSGLAVRYDGSGLEVIHVALAGPGEAGGWRVGERIIAVDGRTIDPKAPSRWARQRAGTKVRLTLADGAQRDLTLADYY